MFGADRQTDRQDEAFGVFQNFADAPKNETQHTQVDKTNDGKDTVMKEVKEIINGKMKGRGKN